MNAVKSFSSLPTVKDTEEGGIRGMPEPLSIPKNATLQLQKLATSFVAVKLGAKTALNHGVDGAESVSCTARLLAYQYCPRLVAVRSAGGMAELPVMNNPPNCYFTLSKASASDERRASF